MRSVQLERDFGDPAALQTYVVTPDMAVHFQRIARGTAARSAARAWRITGDYGVGKSAFALVCAHLLSDPDSAPVTRIADALSWPQTETPTWPFLVTGAREGLASALARGLREGLEQRKPKSKAAARAFDQLIAEAVQVERSNDPAAFEAVLKRVIAQAKSAGAGVLLVVDEMGKLLEYAASGTGREDVFLLQKLAELAQRSGETPFFFITLLHQGFHAYAERLPTVTRNEWAKVAERLEEIVFDQPMAHTAALVAGALGVRTESLAPKVRDAAEATARATASMGWMNGATSAALTLQTTQIYPIHPTLLPVLVRFFSRFGQNERSLFGFLLSSEPFGLQAFAEREEGADVWYGLAEFYDYVRAMFGHRLSGNSYQSHWLRIAGTVDTAHDLDNLEVRVLKAAALLSLIDYPELLATDTALKACLSPALPRNVESAIRTLLDRGLLFRRGRTGGYRLWPSTSVNLTAALEEADRALGPGEGVAAHLDSFLDHDPVLARRHYIDYGTLRYFEVRYALHDRLHEAAGRPSQADGVVLVVLADTEAQCNQAAEQAAAFTHREDLVVGVMAPLATFAAEVHDLRRWGWLRDHTPELAHDPYAAAEVSRQIAAARRALDRALGLGAALRQRDGAAVTWRHQGEIVDTAAGLSGLLSDICDTRFKDAPRISNELLNRKMLSSAAAAARMRLIEGLFSSADRPMFGIDVNKAPPEKSMYLSVIERGGVQQTVDGVLTVALPAPDRDPLKLRPALLEIDGMLDAALGGKVRVRAILDRLSDPPYGVRAGVAPLLLAIILKMRSHELAVYENGTFRATFGGTDFTRLIKGPDTFEVQLCRLEGVRADVFARLAAAFAAPVDRRDPQMLDVVQALCVFAAQLPEYTRKAGVLRPMTARVRDVLLSATEPSTMLFVQLPAACGLAPFTTFEVSDDQRATAFVEAVQLALHDLRTDYSRLLHRIRETVAASIGQCDDGFDRAAIAQRAARVQSAASHIRLKAFAGRLRDPQPSDDLWSASVASYVVAKPPAKWNAADEQRCLEEVTELSQLFHRVEAAAFANGDAAPTAKSAMLVKLTRSTGDDRGLVIQNATLSSKSAKRLQAVSAELGDNRTERLQILTNLIWAELSGQSEVEAENVPDGAREA